MNLSQAFGLLHFSLLTSFHHNVISKALINDVTLKADISVVKDLVHHYSLPLVHKFLFPLTGN